MKTPREILFERHSGMQAKLDSVRKEAIGRLEPPSVLKDVRSASFVEFLSSLRWHLASAAAACMLVMFLNAEGSSEASQTRAAAQSSPSPAQLLAAVQEHRRELLSWGTEKVAVPEPPDQPMPPRRSEVQTTNVSQIV